MIKAKFNITAMKRAARKECLECMGGSSSLVADCTSYNCALHDYRIANTPTEFGVGKRLKGFRSFCLDCVGGVASEVRNCTASECQCYPYRMGR